MLFTKTCTRETEVKQ